MTITPIFVERSTQPRDQSEAPSFDDVYRAHAPTVARWVAKLGGPDVDPDDTIQKVFLIVSRRLHEFRGEAKLTTWLFRIVSKVVANERRSARRRELWSSLTRQAAVAVVPTPVEELEVRQGTAAFYRVLDRLAERYRTVLVLFELDGMNTEEIAHVLRRPPATIRVWLHRARAEFKRRWEEYRRKEVR
jgi:RNA polymerase sigma-70 factor, ECF subfamily